MKRFCLLSLLTLLLSPAASSLLVAQSPSSHFQQDSPREAPRFGWIPENENLRRLPEPPSRNLEDRRSSFSRDRALVAPSVRARSHETPSHRVPVNRIPLPPPVTDLDFPDNARATPEQVALGRYLFFDKILSGNRNLSCATCHHPLTGTGDQLSLSVGEGGVGLGIDRSLGNGNSAVKERVPRNAMALFNLGAREYIRMFHDGRLELRGEREILFPPGIPIPPGLDSLLAAQAMLPVASATEMAGQRGENPVANAVAAKKFAGPGGVWDLLARRLQASPEYVTLFRQAYPARIRSAADISFVDAANAIGIYEAVAFRTDNSSFDRYLRGEAAALDESALRGLELFYGQANCASCHSGKFQTDHEFHAIAVPPLGPGKGDGFQNRDDFGREQVTRKKTDRYRFRTPSLRNVTETGPWGHNGAFSSLEAMLRHHADPVGSLSRYHPAEAILPGRPDLDAIDGAALGDRRTREDLARANVLPSQPLSDAELDDLLSFLMALTDPRSRHLRSEIPGHVPSGLPVSDYIQIPESQTRYREPPGSDFTYAPPSPHRGPGHPQSATGAFDEIVRILPHDARARNAETLAKGRKIVDLIGPFLQLARERR